MRIIDVQQNTPEWLACRIGIPTASQFKRVIQPVRLEKSEGQAAYAAQLVAEWFLGTPLDTAASMYMDRGKELEAEAIARYEFIRDVEAARVGFCITDDGMVGCSPDALIGDDGLLEMKCPGVETHMAALIDPKAFVAEYRCQTQGQLFVTGRYWVDLYSFHPLLPEVCVRIDRDERFMEALSKCLGLLRTRLEAAKAPLEALRTARLEAQAAAMAEMGDGQDLV